MYFHCLFCYDSGKFGIKHMCQILRDKDSGICVTDGDFQTTGSQVSVLVPPSPTVTLSPHCHWFTGTPNPFNSIYKPFIFVPGATIGLAILSPQFGDEDPVKQLPRFKKQVCVLFFAGLADFLYFLLVKMGFHLKWSNKKFFQLLFMLDTNIEVDLACLYGDAYTHTYICMVIFIFMSSNQH